MYAMVYTHPDLARVVSAVSRYMTNLGKEYWKAVQRTFKYLKDSSACLHFARNTDEVISYVVPRFLIRGDHLQSMCLRFEVVLSAEKILHKI